VQDTELYRHLLAIEKPWKVARVALAVKEQRADVFVEHKQGEAREHTPSETVIGRLPRTTGRPPRASIPNGCGAPVASAVSVPS